MQPDFNNMTKPELRAYIIAHPEDRAAFHAFVDRFTADANPETFAVPQSKAEIEDVNLLIQQRVEQVKML